MRLRSWVVCASVAAAFAGCGGDDEPASESASAPETTEQTTAAPPEEANAPTETAAEAASDLPEEGAKKLTDEQKKGLLAKNNEVALGEYDPSATGPVVAGNYREYAEPLAAGPCKTALRASARTWEALAKADEAGNAARLKSLGQKALKNSTSVFEDC